MNTIQEWMKDMWYVELVGILGSLLVLAAMTVKSTTTKGNIAMRSINLIGSLIFVVYGLMIPAYSTAALNIAATIVNAIFIVRMLKDT